MICLGSVVFFFKQKTAYEMRISDWSSDVCSSDLTAKATFTVGAEGVVLESIEVQADKASLGTLVGLEQLDIAWDATGGRWTVDAAQQGDGSGGRLHGWIKLDDEGATTAGQLHVTDAHLSGLLTMGPLDAVSGGGSWGRSAE